MSGARNISKIKPLNGDNYIACVRVLLEFPLLVLFIVLFVEKWVAVKG